MTFRTSTTTGICPRMTKKSSNYGVCTVLRQFFFAERCFMHLGSDIRTSFFGALSENDLYIIIPPYFYAWRKNREEFFMKKTEITNTISNLRSDLLLLSSVKKCLNLFVWVNDRTDGNIVVERCNEVGNVL